MPSSWTSDGSIKVTSDAESMSAYVVVCLPFLPMTFRGITCRNISGDWATDVLTDAVGSDGSLSEPVGMAGVDVPSVRWDR